MPHKTKKRSKMPTKKRASKANEKFSSRGSIVLPKFIRNKITAIVLILLFAAVASYLLLRSFAASGPILATTEAETLALPAGSSIISDAAASGSQAVKMAANGTATGQVSLTAAGTSLTIRAKGTQCKGAPQMVIKVDGVTLLTSSVSSTSWTDYAVTKSLAAGSHSLNASFTNNNSRSGCSRDLYIDKVTFFGEETATTPPPPITSCAKFAATTGSDANAGTEISPFASPQKLLNSLTAGQTGCMRGGSYTQDVKTIKGGAAGAPIVLQSYPGETAVISGKFWIASGSDYTTIQNLTFTGIPNQTTANIPTPIINANFVTLANNDISNNHTAICVGVGSLGPTYGTANNVTITSNKIHDCGRLPAANHDHGIYVEDAKNLVITNNWIYNNSDRGINFYPDMAGSVIDTVSVTHNVFDGNGTGILFSGNNGVAANNITAEYNMITNSNVRYNVESWYPSGTPAGTGNIVRNSCIYGSKLNTYNNGGFDTSAGGFTVSSYKAADPLYADRGNHNFTLLSNSPCLAYK